MLLEQFLEEKDRFTEAVEYCGMMDEMLENKDDILWSELRLGGKIIKYILS